MVFSFDMLAQGKFRGRWAEFGCSVGVTEMQCANATPYLLIDFHGLFCVVEKELFTRRSQVNIHLEAGVLREFPAVRTTAEGAIKGFCDGRIHQGALRLFRPHAAERAERKHRPSY